LKSYELDARLSHMVNDDPPLLLTIGRVSRRSGVASSVLRYYESRDLIESELAGSGHRRYQRSVLRRIAFIVFAQRIGLSLLSIALLSEVCFDRCARRVPTSQLANHASNRPATQPDSSKTAAPIRARTKAARV